MTLEFKLPPLGENITQGDLVKVFVAAQTQVKKDQIILEIETDKAVVEVPSSVDAFVEAVFVKEGQKIKIGEVVFSYQPSQTTLEPTQTSKQAPAPVRPTLPDAPLPVAKPVPETLQRTAPFVLPHLPSGPVLAAPSVRKLAREIGVELHTVLSTHPSGRLSIEDVKAAAKKQLLAFRAKEQNQTQSVPAFVLPDFSKWGSIESKPLSAIRKATALRMAQTVSIPQVTQTDKADITLLEDLRKKAGDKAKAQGLKITATAIFLKLIAEALKTFPQFNASLNLEKEEIIYKNYIHLGVAVETERGLLVPVVRNVDQKSLIDLAKDLTELSEKARLKKTTLEEMQGATFTISNLGGIGGGHFTPIVNPPEVAILGVGKWDMTPVYIDNEFKPRKILPLSLTYDHRLIDGADAARFLRWLCEAMQNPALMGFESPLL